MVLAQKEHISKAIQRDDSDRCNQGLDLGMACTKSGCSQWVLHKVGEGDGASA